jgi:hypothetical protein
MQHSDDDVYVNEGNSYDSGIYYPDAPKEQTEEIAETQGKKAASYPILAELEQWFREQIDYAKDLNNIETARVNINGSTYSRSVSVEGQVLAHQLLSKMLSDKYHEFEDFAKGLE